MIGQNICQQFSGCSAFGTFISAITFLVVVNPASPRRRRPEINRLRARAEVLIDEKLLDPLGIGSVEDVFGRPLETELARTWVPDEITAICVPDTRTFKV